MIRIERKQKQTETTFSGRNDDLKCEIVTFLECLESLMPYWDLHSLKEDVSKINFYEEVIKNDF